eukprot:CAMPEP_0117419318 /NCGR_PEP_ID=MMETSP0758-20121206/910_1 /TAXON_ID=63605 /ORGANISM="Percolomonas cosmopolitus, Strain AE-1 (ATCC 50343)" /LENGTH=135 /DNA_ID=CAMNT_0005200323 /DNA_START=800 /DNA_END=1207 /DNA_ORIENTATION=+
MSTNTQNIKNEFLKALEVVTHSNLKCDLTYKEQLLVLKAENILYNLINGRHTNFTELEQHRINERSRVKEKGSSDLITNLDFKVLENRKDYDNKSNPNVAKGDEHMEDYEDGEQPKTPIYDEDGDEHALPSFLSN